MHHPGLGALSALIRSAQGKIGEKAVSKQTIGFFAVLAVALGNLPRPLMAADLALGEQVFKSKCERCHTLAPGGTQAEGPNLHGVFGRKAATIAGWQFSEPLKASGIVWTPESMGPYLAKPRDVVPEGTMNFIGLKKPEEREAVISYLQQATK
jgi:cytochrome c